MMRAAFALVLNLSLWGAALGGPALVRIYTEDVPELIRAGIRDITHVDPKGRFVEAVVPEDRLSLLARYTYEFKVPDLEARWKAWKEAGILVDFGPYYTYAEAIAKMDTLHARYPNIVSEKWVIGQSIQGRDIYAFRISDNPEMDEDEPAVLLDAVTHAREPGGLSTVFGFVDYLVERYGTDPEITWLIDNREIYIIPIINPDGYVYNEQNSHGRWRKNMRDNDNDGVFEEDYDGVDLNRNFGYMWGYDNTGSSPYPGDQTYRGTGPFSEPETQAVRELTDSVRPVLALNYHTYSNLLIFPWGYVNQPTPDQALFEAMSQIMTAVNGYTYGRPAQLLYPVNGEINDWMYGEQTEKPKVFSWVPEVGEAFWQPDTNIILEQIAENIPMNLYVVRAAGLYLDALEVSFTDQSGSGYLEPGDTVSVEISVRNLSPAETGEGITGVLRALSAEVIPMDSTTNFGDIGPFPTGTASNTDPLTFRIDENAQLGTIISMELLLTDGNGYAQPLVLSTWVGGPTALFADDFESGTGNWTTTQWGLSTNYAHSPTHSFTDSPYGDYGNNAFYTATLATPLDLSQATVAYLTFWGRYEIESGYDFGYVQASTDGLNWTTLASFTGTRTNFQKDSIDLSDFVGEPTVYLRFVLESDFSVTRDGWYVDDVTVYSDAGAGGVILTMTRPEVIDTAGNGNGRLDPGESALLRFTVRNLGQQPALGTVLEVSTPPQSYLSFPTTTANLGDIPSAGEAAAELPVTVSSSAPRGFVDSVFVDLMANGGAYTVQRRFPMPIGTLGPEDPTGPDLYGYYAYEDTDSLYEEAPVFDWLEIAPEAGGPGTPLALGDDDRIMLTLPFTFSYYGQSYTTVWVCSNGWISFGTDPGTNDYSNSGIPDPDGPPGMVAGLWDDLNPGTGGQIAYYHDAPTGRFIMEWHEVPHWGSSTDRETFQIILLDPSMYGSATGDGEIVFQYLHNLTQTDVTIGIENPGETDGIQYYYDGSPDSTALGPQAGRAVKFTTDAPSVHVTEKPAPRRKSFALLGPHPNPATREAQITFTLPAPSPVELTLYDISGRSVKRILRGSRLGAGRYRYTLDLQGLPSGVYFLHLRAGERRFVRKLVIHR